MFKVNLLVSEIILTKDALVVGDRLLEIQMSPEWVKEYDGFISIALTLKEDTYSKDILQLSFSIFSIDCEAARAEPGRVYAAEIFFCSCLFQTSPGFPGEINRRLANDKWAADLKRGDTTNSASSTDKSKGTSSNFCAHCSTLERSNKNHLNNPTSRGPPKAGTFKYSLIEV
jgi:hypothetical protein